MAPSSATLRLSAVNSSLGNAHQDRSIGGGCHSPSRGPFAQEKPVLEAETDVQAGISSVSLWLPLDDDRFRERRGGLAQCPHHETLEPHRFGDEQPGCERLHALLLLEGDAGLQELRSNHGPHRGLLAAARLSCTTSTLHRNSTSKTRRSSTTQQKLRRIFECLPTGSIACDRRVSSLARASETPAPRVPKAVQAGALSELSSPRLLPCPCGRFRPSRDIVVAPKQTFGIEKADFEPATTFPESASALHASSASCISPLSCLAGSLLAHGMPNLRSRLHSGMCICSSR